MSRASTLLGLLSALVLLTTTLSTYAQARPHAPLARATQPSTPAQSNALANTPVFLPSIVNRVTEIRSMEFSSAVDGNGPIDPRSEFDYGIMQLFVTTRVVSGKGLEWRTVWKRDGVVDPNVGTSDVLRSDDERVIDGICFGTIGPDGKIQCTVPVFRGTYQVDFYLAGKLVRTGTAVVR